MNNSLAAARSADAIAKAAVVNRAAERRRDARARVEEKWRAWKSAPSALSQRAYDRMVREAHEIETAYWRAILELGGESGEFAERSARKWAKRTLTTDCQRLDESLASATARQETN